MEYKYKVLRKENNTKVALASYATEDIEIFKAIAKKSELYYFRRWKECNIQV